MCTYRTELVTLYQSSGKGGDGWFPVTDATVYFDHPVHAPVDHSLNIDFRNPTGGPSARVALELSEQSFRALVAAIRATLDSGNGH